MHPLFGPRLRLRIAQEEIVALDKAVQSVGDLNANEVVSEFNAESSEYVFRASNSVRDCDPVWSVKIGEIAHNLRAALDGLTWKVAILSGKCPGKRSQFPIFLVHDNEPQQRSFCQVGRNVHLKEVLPKHRAMFERLQPYQGGNGGSNDPLWVLKELNDADKHRLLHLTAMVALGSKFRAEPFQAGGVRYGFHGTSKVSVGVPLINGAEIGRVRRPAQIPQAEMKMYVQITIEVRFAEGDGAVKGLPVVSTLRAMHGRVGSILDSFDPLFSH